MLHDVIVYVMAASFAAMGLYALATPAAVLERFGVTVETAAGRNEVRAVYGGFGLVVAAMLVYAGATDGPGALWIPSIIALALLGMAAGRLISMAIDRTAASGQVWLFFAVEVIGAVALFFAHTQY